MTRTAQWGVRSALRGASKMYGRIGKLMSVDAQRDALIAILLAGFGERAVTDPIGGHGLAGASRAVSR